MKRQFPAVEYVRRRKREARLQLDSFSWRERISRPLGNLSAKAEMRKEKERCYG
jgi:hypothetical protein